MTPLSSDHDTIPLVASVDPNPVFVFGCCQRSGSTLVQRLLNTHPDLMIWGEHHGYLNQFIAGYHSLLTWKAEHPSSVDDFMALADRTFMPNAIADIGALDDAFRKHVAALFPVPQRRGVGSRWGFKETRYGIDIAFFLEKLFPGARFIHLVRHAANCLSSMRRLEADGMWQREWTDQAIGNWLSINRGFLDSSDQLRHYLLVRYEDLEGSEKEFQVDRIERFIGVQPTSLDRAALARHVDFAPKDDHRKRLNDEDNLLLHSPDFVRTLQAYGYGG